VLSLHHQTIKHKQHENATVLQESLQGSENRKNKRENHEPCTVEPVYVGFLFVHAMAG